MNLKNITPTMTSHNTPEPYVVITGKMKYGSY